MLSAMVRTTFSRLWTASAFSRAAFSRTVHYESAVSIKNSMAVLPTRAVPLMGRSLAAACVLGGFSLLTQQVMQTQCAQVAQSDGSGHIRVLCLHGVTSDMFGNRGVVYGSTTLAEIDSALHDLARELGVTVECFATNDEGTMAERIHQAFTDGVSAVVINPGAWTHYSYGLRDALAILKCPIIEVHMSNMYAREDMHGSKGEDIRHHSVVSPIAKGIVCGLDIGSYLLGLRAAVTQVRGK